MSELEFGKVPWAEKRLNCEHLDKDMIDLSLEMWKCLHCGQVGQRGIHLAMKDCEKCGVALLEESPICHMCWIKEKENSS